MLDRRHRTSGTCSSSPACSQPAEGRGDDAGEGQHGAGGDQGEAGGAEELALRRLHLGERASCVLLRRLQYSESTQVPQGLKRSQQSHHRLDVYRVYQKGGKVTHPPSMCLHKVLNAILVPGTLPSSASVPSWPPRCSTWPSASTTRWSQWAASWFPPPPPHLTQNQVLLKFMWQIQSQRRKVRFLLILPSLPQPIAHPFTQSHSQHWSLYLLTNRMIMRPNNTSKTGST